MTRRLPKLRPGTRRILRRVGRYATFAVVLVAAVLAALYVAGRVYMPTVVAQKAAIEARLSEAAGHRVALGDLESDWDGVYPGVRVLGVTVYGADGRTPSVEVNEAHASVVPWPLLWGEVRLRELVLARAALTVERQADGRLRIAGLAPSDHAPAGARLSWLLSQSRLALRDSKVRWIDVREPDAALQLNGVDLRLRNSGNRHRLTARADFPDALCARCEVVLDVRGDPFGGSWNGEIAIDARALDVQALPLVMRERLPADLRGRFDARLWSEWEDGRPRTVRGDASVTDFSMPFGPQRRTLRLRQVAGGIAWRAQAHGWRLDLAQLTLGLTRTAWSAGRVRLERRDTEDIAEIEHIELDDISAFVAEHQSEHPLLRRWTEVQPRGALDDVKISVEGASQAPSRYRVSARLVDLQTAEHDKLPSVRGLSGRLAFDAETGEFDLDAANLTLHLPVLLHTPLAASRAAGVLKWRRTKDAWQVDGAALRLESAAGSGAGTFGLLLPHDRARSPALRLRVDFRNGDVARVVSHFPRGRFPERVQQWLGYAFIGGRVTNGHLIFDGPIRDFPFEQGQGRFELRAQVRDGAYRYLRGWTPVTQVDAEVVAERDTVSVTGRGRIGTLQARDVRVDVGREAGDHVRRVQVRANIDGPVAETVRVLQAVETGAPASAWKARVPQIARASGTGALKIDLRVPLKSQERPAFLAEYRLTDAALKLSNGAGIDAATGVVRFSESGLRDSGVRARLYGGPAVLAAIYDGGELRMQASGTAMLADVLRGRPHVAQRVSGGIDWSLRWHDRAGGPRLHFESNLSKLRLRLPPPLALPDGGLPESVTLTTARSDADSIELVADASAGVSGKLLFVRADGTWRFSKGRFDIGRQPSAEPSQRDGLQVGLNIDAIEIDQWLPLLDSDAREAPQQFLTGLSAEIKQLGMLNRQWGRAFLHVVRAGDSWRLVMDGDAAAGEGSFTPAGRHPAQVRLDLAYLRLPERRDDRPADQAADPRRLPTLDLHVYSFEYKQRHFGDLSMRALSQRQGWRVESVILARPEAKLSVNGLWRRRGERESSEFDVELASEDMGTTLDAWGAEGQMSDGKVKLQASLSWPGSPTRPTLAGLNGKVEVTAEKGRFLQFDPGAARLFGLLDLRSIGRYLTLDFSPAFGKGFTFDAINGTISIERGNATTSNLIVKGPSLGLAASGRVGLAAEDYDLVLEASPRLSDTLTLTSWGLFGPQAAAAVLAFQRLFRKQIEEGTRVTYVVKGPWDNPTVTKLAKQRPAQAPPTHVP